VTTFLRKCTPRLFDTITKKQISHSFHKIEYGAFILYFLLKEGICYVGYFSKESSTSYIKLFLLHMCVAFINFNGALIDTLKTMDTEQINQIDFSRSEFFQLKIYELYFLKHLVFHFNRIFRFLVNKEEMYLSYIKFKNMYILDLSTGEIIFDMLSVRKSKKNIKYFKNEKLWLEILHHSRNLMDAYKTDYGSVFDAKDSFYRFVKLECTSTYPRMIFIIKFLPILNGISIIHVYSQKKLSRVSDNSDQPIPKGYKEIDLLYGADVKNNSNIEFRYSEPKKLQEIEKFLIEFYISIRTNSNVYYDINHELKYFDYSIITLINEILVTHRENWNREPENLKTSTIDSLISKINIKLYENYTNMKNNGAEKILNEELKPIELNSIERDTNNSINFLLIKKENILRELFSESMDKMKNLDEINKSEYDKPVAEYIEHEDGWAMRTKKNGFGYVDKKPDNNFLIKKDTINSNIGSTNTLILSKFDKESHCSKDISLDLGKSQSVISKFDDELLNRGNLVNTNANYSIHTLDHLMSELDREKSYEKTNLIQELYKNRKSIEFLDPNILHDLQDIPKHNILETLIRQKTKSLKESNNASDHLSHQARLSFNLLNIGNTKAGLNRRGTNIYTKVRLTLYEESPELSPKPQSGKDYIKIQHSHDSDNKLSNPDIIKIKKKLSDLKESNYQTLNDSNNEKSKD
jgi:hypothetical protein